MGHEVQGSGSGCFNGACYEDRAKLAGLRTLKPKSIDIAFRLIPSHVIMFNLPGPSIKIQGEFSAWKRGYRCEEVFHDVFRHKVLSSSMQQ